jgi:hypothetical protein
MAAPLAALKMRWIGPEFCDILDLDSMKSGFFSHLRLITAKARSDCRGDFIRSRIAIFLSRAASLLAALTFLGQMFNPANAASAQTPSYIAVTTESVMILAQKLKQDLQDGSILLADLHAIQLRLALAGVPREQMSSRVSVIEQQPNPDKNEPQLTAGLVPVADKLIQDLEGPDQALARRDLEQLAAQIHKQHELYRRERAQSGMSGDARYDRYLDLSDELQQSLRKGDIATAAVLAGEVQDAEDSIIAAKGHPLARSKNIYNINDALGRAAFLRKDYATASDYLLRMADTSGDPALRTFGPDLWLAQALATTGYKDVVVTFLERSKAFWSGPHVDEWISVLHNGGSPDFSHNIWSAEPVLSH